MSYVECQVTAYRNNLRDKKIISSIDLVPGDIFEILEQRSLPCDAVLISGTCLFNEAMLTGESIPVIKNPLPTIDKVFDIYDEKQYTMYSGTLCLRARNLANKPVLGIVTRTGFTTMKGGLIRTMLFQPASDFKFYRDSFIFIGLLALMALGGTLTILTKGII